MWVFVEIFVWCTRFFFEGLNHTRNFHFFFTAWVRCHVKRSLRTWLPRTRIDDELGLTLLACRKIHNKGNSVISTNLLLIIAPMLQPLEVTVSSRSQMKSTFSTIFRCIFYVLLRVFKWFPKWFLCTRKSSHSALHFLINSPKGA